MTWRIIGNQRLRAVQWASSNYPGLGFETYDKRVSALILERGLEIHAVSLYKDYQPGNSIEIHCAAVLGKPWLTRPFLAAAFRYPFLDLKVRRLGTLVPANNLPSLKFVRHLGFVQEGIAREAWAENVDVICFGMLKSECRFLDLPAPEIWSIGDEQARSPGSPGSSQYDSSTINC